VVNKPYEWLKHVGGKS